MLIAICDDIPDFCAMLKESLLAGNFLNQDDRILEFHSAKEFLEKAPLSEVDLLFLDIEMPEMTGIELLRQYRHLFRDTKVVLLTSHLDFVFDGYKYQVYRYLKKPAQPDELAELFHDLDSENLLSQTISLHTTDGKDLSVKLQDILYIEVYNNYTYVTTTQQSWKSWKCYIRLKDFKLLLPEDYFCQPNQSYLVNMKYIQQLDLKNRQITMPNGTPVDISFRCLKDFKKQYANYQLLK